MSHTLWYPYAQMKQLEINHEVRRAEGVYLHLASGERLIDAVSSWWCVIHGYNHPELNQAAQAQLEQVAHVMLGGLKNAPAQQLADKLVEITPPSLQHVFFSDSGSVGVEVALKMAVQFWQNQGQSSKQKILSLRKAYHGDTTGCMSVSDCDEGMHHLFNGILPQQYFAPAPYGGYEANDADIAAQLDHIEQLMQQHQSQLAAMIVEPLLQGAGGLQLYSPRLLDGLRALCDQYQLLLIFDEVATGFGRTGRLFACNHCQIEPDIMVLAKGLTAGYIGHAATLANSRVFDAFYSDNPSKAFMHGPTFMGNPLACAIALKSIEIFERDDYLSKIANIEARLQDALLPLQHPFIKQVRVLGAAAVIEVHNSEALQGVQAFAAQRGVWLRPFENYLYTMPPYIINAYQLQQITDCMVGWFQS